MPQKSSQAREEIAHRLIVALGTTLTGRNPKLATMVFDQVPPRSQAYPFAKFHKLHALMQCGEYEKMNELAHTQLGEHSPGDFLYAGTLYFLGGAAWAVGDGKGALNYFRQARKENRNCGDETLEAATIAGIGLAYFALYDLDKAQEHAELAHEKYLSLGNRIGTTDATGNLAEVYEARGELDKAQTFSEQAAIYYRELGRIDGLANQLGIAGNIHVERGQHKEAIQKYEAAYELMSSSSHKRGASYILSMIGVCKAEMATTGTDLSKEDFDHAIGEALKALFRARSMIETLGIRSDLRNAAWIAICYDRLGQSELERQHAKLMRNMANEQGVVPEDCHVVFSELFKEMEHILSDAQ